ncbi:MAG: hypothetical protein ACFWUC_13885 [Oscillospiraceae bacterium]|jgi:phage minor structural protein
MLSRHFRKIENLPLLFDINGDIIGFLKDISDININYQISEAAVLTFTSSGISNIKVDQEIIYQGERFLVTKIENDKSNTEKTFVECDSALIELNDKTVKKVEFTSATIAEGLKKILNGSGWSVGSIDADDYLHSMSETNKTVLNLIRTFAALTRHEIVFDTINRTVSFVKQIGEETNFVFRYRKNIQSIKRTIFAPEATVLYPIGRGGLTIESVNEGISYIEDYSWYTEQGISLQEARKKFKKEYYWEDERFIYAGNLMRAGIEKLAELARPRISYEMDVIAGAEQLKIGDYAWVIDDELGMKLKVRVVRMNIVPGREWENTIEFDYVIPGLQDDISETGTSITASSESNMILVTNESDISVGTSYTAVLEMSFSTYAPTNMQVGLVLVGTASTDLTLDGYFDIAGERVGVPIRQRVLTGKHIISMTFLASQIQEGSDFLRLYLKTDTGTFKVCKNESQLYIISQNLLGGLSAELPKANVIEEVELENAIQVTDGNVIEQQVPIKCVITEAVMYGSLDVADNVAVEVKEVEVS